MSNYPVEYLCMNLLSTCAHPDPHDPIKSESSFTFDINNKVTKLLSRFQPFKWNITALDLCLTGLGRRNIKPPFNSKFINTLTFLRISFFGR